MPREGVHYACITCITSHSVVKIEKKNYPQVYLEKFSYNIKEINMPEFTDVELESDSSSDSE